MSESHGEEVLTSISPQISNVQSTPAKEASSSGDQDPIKETHRDEQKEAVKKPTVTGPARRPVGTAASSAASSASVAAAPPRRTGTVLQRPPNRPPPGSTGAGAAAPRRTPSNSMATAAAGATTTTTASNTTNPPAATSKTAAPSSGVARRSSAIGTPSPAVTRTPDKRSFGAGRSISPTVDRRLSSNIISSANAARRTVPAASTTTTAPSHRPRPSLSSAASSGSIGRPSTATSARESTVSPGPPPAAGRPTPAPVRGLTGSSGLSRTSFPTPRSRTGGPGTPPAAPTTTTPGKELEALKAKVSGLEEKNKELREQVSRAAKEPITNGEAKAATKDLEAELNNLKAKIATIQQANEGLRAQCEKAEQKCTEFASAVETSARMMKSTNETIQAKHAQEIQSLRESFQAKENGLLADIEALKRSFEDLNNRHAEEVLKLTSQLREAAEAAQSKAAKETSDHQEAIRAQALAHDKAVEALNAALATEKEAGSKASSDTQGTINKLTDQITTLEKQLEEANKTLNDVAIKDQDALEDHQREIDGLKNVIRVLQDEVEAVTLGKNEELDGRLAELRERHGTELSEAVNAGKAATKDVEAKMQALIKEHQQELDVKLEEVRSEAKIVEEDLLLRLEAEKLHSAEAHEAAQESETQRKELYTQLDALNTEWEGKVEQLQKLNNEKVGSLIAQLDAAQAEIIDSASKIGKAKQGDDALKLALEEGRVEVEVLKKSLSALQSESLKNAKLERDHKATLDSQSAEYTARIEAMEADLTSGNEKYTTLSKKYIELEQELEATKSASASETSRLTAELAKTGADIKHLSDSHGADLESYETRLQTEKTTVVQLQAALAGAPDRSTFDALAEQLDEASALKNSELENLQKVLGEQISTLEAELAQEKATNQELLDKISSIETKVSALMAKNEELKVAVEKSEAAEAGYKSLEAIYEVQKAEFTNEIKALKEKLGAGENGIGKDGIIDKLESAKREAEAAILRLEEEKNASEATLEAELGALKREKDAALEEASLQVSSLNAATAKISTTLETLTNEKSDLEAELKLLQEDHAGMEELIRAKESAIEQVTKDSDQLEVSLKEKLGNAEALVREKDAELANIEKESAASLKVLEAEIAELRLYKKNQELSASQSPSTANVAALKMQLSQLEAANEEMNKENARMLKTIEKNLPMKTF